MSRRVMLLPFAGAQSLIQGATAVALRVKETDGSPDVTNVNTVQVSNGSLTDNGSGDVSINLGAGGGDSTTTNALGSRPAAGNDGNLFLPTLAPYVQRDNGSIWESWGPLFKFPTIVPPAAVASWTWVNQGPATAVDTAYGILMADVNLASENRWRFLKKAAPATPYTIVMGYLNLMPIEQGGGFSNHGFIWRASGSENMISVGYGINTTPRFRSYDWTLTGGATGSGTGNWGTATANDEIYSFVPQVVFIKITDDGTNRIYYYSLDYGATFTQVRSEARTTHITANEVGWGFYCRGSSSAIAQMALFHWAES